MAIKLICGCLLALALSCLADAQYFNKQPSQQPERPQIVPQRHTSPQPRPPQPQQPQQPQRPQPQRPKEPQQPEAFHSCEVEANYKIACGPPSISASECEAINCCYDGQMCYYGKAVTLQCTKDAQMIVVVARDATLPNLDLEALSFLSTDERCNPVGVTSAFAIYQFPLTECGTVMTEEPGLVIYENRLSSSREVAIGPYGSITRDTDFELLVQCRYIGTTVEALVIDIGTIYAPDPVAAPGPLYVELRLGNGECTMKGCVEEDVAYNSFYGESDYPVSKVLREPVYVEVRMLERTDPNLVLTLGRCWATTGSYPHSFPQWDLLIDGCPFADDHYRTVLVPVDSSSGLQFPTHHSRFSFKMFTFVSMDGAANSGKGGATAEEAFTPLKEKVFIHCETTVCQPSAGDNCQPRCHRKKREISGSAITVPRPEATLVSSGEINFCSQHCS